MQTRFFKTPCSPIGKHRENSEHGRMNRFYGSYEEAAE